MKPENLTAWALNELSAAEQARIEAEIGLNPAAQQQAATTKDFCDFLTTELRDEALALRDAQRERMRTTEALSPVSAAARTAPILPGRQWWQQNTLYHLAAAAAIAILGAASLLIHHEQKEAKAKPQVALYSSESVRVANPTKTPPPLKKSAVPTVADLSANKNEQLSVAQKFLLVASSQSELGNYDQAMSAYEEVLRLDPYNSAARRGMEKVEQKSANYFESARDHQRSRMLSMVNEAWNKSASASTSSAPISIPASTPAAPSGSVIGSGGIIKAGSGTLTLGGTNTYTGGTVSGKTVAHAQDGAGYLGLTESERERLKLAQEQLAAAAGKKLEYSDSTESYTLITENALISVAGEPLSTFSIDVDTASYANVRRFLNQNTKPPSNAVRIEELINYFPTGEEGPEAGSKEPFAVKVEMAACPWQPQHRLARVHLKGRELGNERKASNLVFLVDVSGSMNEPNKLPLVQQSLRMLTEKLGEGDRVAMVTYAGSTDVVLASTNGEKKADIIAAIGRLQPGGSTHGSAGIRLAYEQAVAGFIKGGVNRVILCTDGDFNVGVTSPQELETLITEKARSGVFLSVLGYGTGNLKDRTMETLADKGNGNYAYIDSLSEARKVLIEQMGGTLVTIAKDVKVQVEFNPALVRHYRLIGYENRLLAKEDFNDDTKDAGEIGAGHSVTALYELVPANLPPGVEPPVLVDKLKYQQQPVQQLASPAPPRPAPAALSKEALTVKLRYKQPEGTTSKLIEVPLNDDARRIEDASAEFQFTAAVAGFGLLLRESSYAGQLTWEQVRQLALRGKGTDTLGYRGEFLQLIEKARGVAR